MSDEPPGLLSTIGHDVGAGFTNWWHRLSDVVDPPAPKPLPPGEAPPPPPTPGQQAAQTVRRYKRSWRAWPLCRGF